MKILASGMSGTIGQKLLPVLMAAGHSVTRLKTHAKARTESEIPWDPVRPIAPERVSGFDAVIHLAGENIFGRWTAAKKTRIHESRALGTHNLCETLASCHEKPTVLLTASAIGFYGAQRGAEVLTESSAPGKGFLAEVTRDWETATQVAQQAGMRVVNLRISPVISSLLQKLRLPFLFGLGGKIGDGRQWMSWISVDDAVGAILHCLQNDSLDGPVNLAAPNPLSNAEFTMTLGRVLHRPTFATVPASVIRLVMGKEMAEATALSSQRVVPERLLQSGYRFKYPDIRSALAAALRTA